VHLETVQVLALVLPQQHQVMLLHQVLVLETELLKLIALIIDLYQKEEAKEMFRQFPFNNLVQLIRI